jgi:hypothetical protein
MLITDKTAKLPDDLNFPPLKKNKYHAKPIVVGGVKWDSTGEYNRWQELKLLEGAGEIDCLSRQKVFVVQDKFRDNTGKTQRAIKMRMDFVYRETDTGRWIAEDYKGFTTAHWKDKAKMFRMKYTNYTLRITKGK